MASSSHFGVSVRDLERSTTFYRDYFGFTCSKTFEKAVFEIRGALLERDDIALELLEPYSPVTRPEVSGPLPTHLRSLGANHIALSVEKCAELYDRMVAEKVVLITELIDSRTFFCADPDGTPIEVKQA